MTGWGWALCLGLALVFGAVIGLALLTLCGPHIYRHGLEAGEAKTLLQHGLHPAVFEGCNTREIPRPRPGRAGDTQLVTRTPPGRTIWPSYDR